MIHIGVIGCGHWGPNHVRSFSALPGSSVAACCDINKKSLARLQGLYPSVATTVEFDDILQNPDIDAVVIATPTASHYKLTRAALLAGKDVLCEKPLAMTSKEARDLVALACARKRILMVGHVFMFNAGIREIRNYVTAGTMGKVYYLCSTRTNLGPIRSDVNVVHDLAVHDISIFNFLLNSRPVRVNATGLTILQKRIEDITFISLYYPKNILANIHVSWLDPRKVREITVVGDRKMAVWNDLSPTDMVRVYDKGVVREPYYKDFGEFQLLIREGNVTIPKVNAVEPLRVQAQHFLECVEKRTRPLSDGRCGLEVVRVVEAVQKSLKRNGAPVAV